MSNFKRFSFALSACFAGFLLAEFSGISQAKADPPPCPFDANNYSVGWGCLAGSICVKISPEVNSGQCGTVWSSSCTVVGGACSMGSQCRILCPGL